jgi:hypothetical protein
MPHSTYWPCYVNRIIPIDDDVLEAATGIARQQGTSIGSVLSDLARSALRRPAAARNGITLLARGEGQAVVTLETVNALRDELL